MALVATTEKLAFDPAHTTWLAGWVVITGSCASMTVTVKLQVDELPQTSVAVTVTVVTPIGNAEPDAWLALIVTAPPQLSVAEQGRFKRAGQNRPAIAAQNQFSPAQLHGCRLSGKGPLRGNLLSQRDDLLRQAHPGSGD